jgi:hypothetical protein
LILETHLFKTNNWNRKQDQLAHHAAYSMHNSVIVINQIDLPLFDSLVAAVLDFSVEVWDFDEGQNIEKSQNKFCRKILRVNQS